MKYLTLMLTAFLVCSCTTHQPSQLFSVSHTSQRHEIGEAEAYLTGVFSLGRLKKTQLNVFYYPKEDAVCLNFKHEFAECNQFLNKVGREAFISAFKLYQEEFEQKKLTNKNLRNTKVYGTVQGFFMWRRTVLSVRARGNPRINFGYQFKEDSVFFSTTQSVAEYVDPESRDSNQSYPVFTMYFTKEQAKNLTELFSHEFLQNLVNPTPAPSEEDLDQY